ncbi:S-layer homology domain-containing protein [Paenibacillus sp. N1-5-1-14]|uniref:S-layer homology domain-containing protein n=1 Tax=Paenibacillus radicibacter TaxID=2972488 RepID=UPI002159534C|nr:S-layer homology domain-containing protein [Paenibacillus radicibacter]MCR8643206.1 S-layer homology domain-containing protein [Paenibacillus radicibacter]
MRLKKRVVVSSALLVALVGSGFTGMGNLLQGKSEGLKVAYAAPANFTDIGGHWAAADIMKAVEGGIAAGYEDGSFRPDQEVKRSEFIKLLTTALKLPNGADGANWYDKFVAAATKEGFYKNDFTASSMEEAIPRKEMVKLAGRAAALKYEFGEIEEKQWLWEAAKAGIVHGKGNGDVAPDGTTTRAEAIAIVNRVTDVKAGKKLPVDKYAISGAEIYWHKTNVMSMLPRYFTKPYKYDDGSYDKFRDDLMHEEKADGNYIAETERFVVIDLDDKNDPNRHLIPEGSKRFIFSTRQAVDVSNGGYAVIAVNKLKVKKNVANFDLILSAYTFIGGDIRNVNDLSKKAQKLDGLIVNDANKSSNGALIAKENTTVTYITGQFIPKGDWIADPTMEVTFSPIGKFNTPMSNLLSSWTRKEISN